MLSALNRWWMRVGSRDWNFGQDRGPAGGSKTPQRLLERGGALIQR